MDATPNGADNIIGELIKLIKGPQILYTLETRQRAAIDIQRNSYIVYILKMEVQLLPRIHEQKEENRCPCGYSAGKGVFRHLINRYVRENDYCDRNRGCLTENGSRFSWNRN